MKILAYILSIYILILTFVPCSDVHWDADDYSHISLIQQQDNHNHQDNEIDLCSPFCFCNCCQTLSQPDIFASYQANLTFSEITYPLLIQNNIDRAISFWHPPKI